MSCNLVSTIQGNECIGDSRDKINLNFAALQSVVCSLSTNTIYENDSTTIDLTFTPSTRNLIAGVRNDSITTDQLANNAVTANKVAPSAIRGQTSITNVYDPDELLLYSDSLSALRRVTASKFGKLDISTTAPLSATGQTEVNFTNLPPWTKKITIVCNKISVTSNGYALIQIGTSSGFDTTNYEVVVATSVDSSITSSGVSNGFLINQQDMSPGYTLTGTVNLTNLIGTNTWVANLMLGTATTGNVVIGTGTKTLSGTLDRVRLFAGAGIGTFNGGTLNIICEG